MLSLLLLLKTSLASDVVINGDFITQGTVNCNNLDATSVNANGSIRLSGSIQSNSFYTTQAVATEIQAGKIQSPSGVLYLEGDLEIGSASSTSFIENSWIVSPAKNTESVRMIGIQDTCQGVPYYKINCDPEQSRITQQLILPKHSYLKIKGTYHMIDMWKGEQVMLKVDDKVIWSDTAITPDQGIDVCGSESPDAAYGLSLDIMIPHTNTHTHIEFVSSLEKNCKAAFGLEGLNFDTL